MSLRMKDHDSAFCLPPAGVHIATCIGLIDLGVAKHKYYGSASEKVLIVWELADTRMPDGKPFTLDISYRAHLNAKSKLRILLEKWRGKKFSLKELYGFQLENMLAEPCCLTLTHDLHTDGEKYISKIADISPLPASIPRPKLHNRPIAFDLSYYSEREYLALPESIRRKIKLSS